MTDLFDPSRRRRLFLKKGKGRSVQNRHPWVYSGAIAREEGEAGSALGDLFGSDKEHLGSGWYSPHSQIRLRLLTFGDEPLTRLLLQDRIANAIARRAELLSDSTTAVRLIHAEGDELPGLIVDRYGESLVVEISVWGLDKLRDEIAVSLEEICRPSTLLFRNDLPARRLEQLATTDEKLGEARDETEILEQGLRFAVPLGSGQKTGFFLDQRENRSRLRAMSRGCRALNLFSYIGAFGVYAAAGGARQVTEVEISAPALALARRNHELNPSQAELEFIAADAFGAVRSLFAEGSRFDLVVCDPPAFVKSRATVDRAARGYKDINLYAMRLIEKGGSLFTFSCSSHLSLDLFQKIIFAAALDAGRRVAILERLGAGRDHPVSVFCPESEYLKGFLLRVD